MRTKILSFILAICLLITPCILLTGCGKDDEEDDYKNLPTIEVITDIQIEEILDSNFKISYKEFINSELNNEVTAIKYGGNVKVTTMRKTWSEPSISLVHEGKVYSYYPEMPDGNGGTIPARYVYNQYMNADELVDELKFAVKPDDELKYEEVKDTTFLDRACKEYKVRDISGHINTYIIDNESGLILKRISDTYTFEATEFNFEPSNLDADINLIVEE